MGILIIIFSVALLAFLSYKGVHVILSAFIAAAAMSLLMGMDVYTAITSTMMSGTGGFITNYFLLFILGGVLAKVLETSGATESLAKALCHAFGTKYIMIPLVLIGAIITMGGVNIYVAFFACTPVALSMLRQANLPRRLWIGAWIAGTSTFAMTAPFMPTMQNAVGIKFLGTTAAAGWQIGLIGWIPFVFLIFLHEYRAGIKAQKQGEVFVPFEDDTYYDENAALPHWILPCIPIAALFILVNFFRMPLETAMLLITVLSIALLWKFLPHKSSGWSELFATSFKNASLAIINPAVVVGFASLVTSTEAFANLASTAVELNWDPLVTAAGLAGLGACFSGSCMAGISITLPACVDMYGDVLNLATLHRVSTIAAGTFDTLPHCGALHSYATITKQKLNDFYWDVFFCSVLCPVGAVALSIIAAKLLGLQYM